MSARLMWSMVGALLLTSLAGCAVNPVSGQTEMALISEEKEIELGKKNDVEVRKHYGVYNDKQLQAYVDGIGQQLAKRSHRPNIKYTFTVLDSPEVNAFALPGGYIYITRGILAYVNSEAELAAVIGHEIGHVTARHSVRQYSKAAATSVGFTVASILVPELRTDVSQQLLNVLGNAIISGYGREAELEADRLGAEYIARDGYQPTAMIDVIGVLKNQEESERERAKREHREPQVYHGVFASHPSADNRLQQVVAQAEHLKLAGHVNGRAGRQRYLERINGVVFGDPVSQGIRRNNRFYHKGLGLTLEFPQGWQIENRPTQLLARNAARDALIDVRPVEYKDKKLPAPEQLVKEKLKTDVIEGGALTDSRLPSFSTIRKLRSPWGKRKTRVTALYFGGQAYLIYGTAKDEKRFAELDPVFLKTMSSLRPLNNNEIKLAEGLHIRVVHVRPGQTFSSLARQSPVTNYPELTLRLINNKFPNGTLAVGEQIKLIE